MNKRKVTRYWKPYHKDSKHLYLITNGHHYKLGITKNIETRVKDIQTANATKVKLIKTWSFKSGREAYEVEGYLLENTSASPAENEWFEDNRCRDLIIKEIDKAIEIILKKGAKQTLYNGTFHASKKISNLKQKKIPCLNEFLLIIYFLENHRNVIKELAQEFFVFTASLANTEIFDLLEVIELVKAEDSARKESTLFAKAMMIHLNLTDEGVVTEFTRVMDKVRLQYEPFYTQRLIDLAEQKQLSQERKENLQKLIALRDNLSENEERLIDLLNHYS